MVSVNLCVLCLNWLLRAIYVRQWVHVQGWQECPRCYRTWFSAYDYYQATRIVVARTQTEVLNKLFVNFGYRPRSYRWFWGNRVDSVYWISPIGSSCSGWCDCVPSTNTLSVFALSRSNEASRSWQTMINDIINLRSDTLTQSALTLFILLNINIKLLQDNHSDNLFRVQESRTFLMRNR